MNKTAEQAEAFCRELLKNGSDCGNRVIIFVPYTDLSLCARLCENSFAAVGAQNVHWENSGAFTGEISAQMLREAGAEYVLTGHSERRALFGETDETVAKRTVVAYEPVWAIGTGKTASAEQARDAIACLRGVLRGIFDTATAESTYILYGGSMNEKNAFSLLSMKGVDGGLIGGASLDAEKFISIIKAYDNTERKI